MSLFIETTPTLKKKLFSLTFIITSKANIAVKT